MPEILRVTNQGATLDDLLATLRQQDVSGVGANAPGRRIDWQGGGELTTASGASTEPVFWYWFLSGPPTGSILVLPDKASSTAETIGAMPATDQVALVVRFLGLGKSQIARIFDVSRQTIYDWLKGRCEPTGRNATNLTVLAKALHTTCAGAERPLFHRYVAEEGSAGEPSVLALLEVQPWVEADLTSALVRARRRTEARDRRLGQSKSQKVTETLAEDNYLDNSIAENME